MILVTGGFVFEFLQQQSRLAGLSSKAISATKWRGRTKLVIKIMLPTSMRASRASISEAILIRLGARKRPYRRRPKGRSNNSSLWVPWSQLEAANDPEYGR